MHIDDNDPYVEYTAMIVEEIIRQRIQGIKNEVGVYITPAFPKLVYVLDENNIRGGKYSYITKLAAQCTAKRLYPDYISAKKMREIYEGNVFSPMGCVEGKSLISYKIDEKEKINVSFTELWDKMSKKYNIKEQTKGVKDHLYIETPDLKIFDNIHGWVKCPLIIRNTSTNWCTVTLKNGKRVRCTHDHPFEVVGKGMTHAIDLNPGDPMITSSTDVNIKSCVLTEVESITFEQKTIEFSYDVTTESEHFEVNGIYSHNCRSFLSPWKDENGEYKWEGRFNQGVVSINLPQIGIIANGDEGKFFTLLDERLELCKKALLCRHKALIGTTSDISPIHWQYGAIARLKKGEKIDKYLFGGYSTLSLGYIGVYEMTIAMKGCSHTTEEGHDFALRVMTHLKKKIQEWKEETGIGFALYGTPAESLCYRFAEIDKKKFGNIKNITDKGYYTNSYHVDVREKVDAFSKFKFESEFQNISSGGAISYVEIPNLMNNVAVIEKVQEYIYDTIMYGEFNTKSDYCHVCGYDGEIILNEEGEWECPQCGNKDHDKMNVTRRT